MNVLRDLEAILRESQNDSLTLHQRWTIVDKSFYQFVNALSNERITAFHNFYARCRYAITKVAGEPTDSENFDGLRRFCKEKPQRITEQDVLQGKLLIGYAIGRMLGRPAHFADQFDRQHFSKKFYTPAVSGDLLVLCDAWTGINENNGGKYFYLHGYLTEQLANRVSILVKDFRGTPLTYVHPLLSKGSVIRLTGVNQVNTRPQEYSVTSSTNITIEPDFLIDATGIGGCFQYDWNRGKEVANSDIFLFSKLIDSLSGEAALRGSIVGYYLDEMVRGENDFNATFEAAKQIFPLKSAQFGRDAMEEMKITIRNEHYANLLSLVEQERGEGKKLWIEPTYYSKEYGLQGRIDLLGMHEVGPRDIVELKSGRPTNPVFSVAWTGHKFQVVNYDLLLQSTYGSGVLGTKSVYYSKCTESPYRNIASEDREAKNSVYVRNKIVADLYRLAENDHGVLTKISEHGISNLPTFSNVSLTNFQNCYGENVVATKYYNELFSFVLRELIDAKVGGAPSARREGEQNGFAGLWLDSLDQKKEDYAIIDGLRVIVIDEQNGYVTAAIGDDAPHTFRKGDLVVFYPIVEGRHDALSQHILKGSINAIDSDQVEVSLFNKQTDYSFIQGYSHWAIEADIFERNYWSTISNLFNILSVSDRKINLLLGEQQPAVLDLPSSVNHELNENQNLVLQQALCAQDYYLLQGPPGTGKTSTFLINYLRATLQSRGDRVIVLAFTNKAVDKICESLREPRTGLAIDYIRLGSKHVEDDYLFNTQVKRLGNDPDVWREVLENARVIVSTVSTFQNKCLLLKEFMEFDQVVVDEASQLTEASLSGVVLQFKKYVLIGDQKQLPAVITQHEIDCKVKDEALVPYGITDLRISLFERLYENAVGQGWGNATGQLTTHYRMHEEIAAQIAQHYRQGLTCGLAAQHLPEESLKVGTSALLNNFGRRRLNFIECPPEAVPKKNLKEARICAELVVAFRELDYPVSEIGVITPFRAQITEIKRLLPKELLNDENFVVDTVERFQGDERKIIIYSTTVANSSQLAAMQSIAPNDEEQRTDRKLLVSLSRASERFFLLGNATTLRGAPQYALLLESMADVGPKE